MSAEILAQRLKDRIAQEVAANHTRMDKGVPHDEYMKLVGRNVALGDLKGFIAEAMKDIGESDDD